MNKRLKTLWKSARTQQMRMQVFAICLLAAVVLLGCSDDRESPTAPSSVTLATAVSNSTSDDTTLVGSDTTLPVSEVALNTGQLPIRTAATDSNAVPLTANVLHPSDHEESPFTIELIFSEPIVTKPRHFRGHKYAFWVSNGTITDARRQNGERRTDGKRGNKASHWQLTVEPSGEDDVRLVARANKNCAGASSFCTQDGRSLSHALDLTIRGTAPETAESHFSGSQLPRSVGYVTVEWSSLNGNAFYVSWNEVLGNEGYYAIEISSLDYDRPRCARGGYTIRHTPLTGSITAPGSTTPRVMRAITAAPGMDGLATQVFSVHAVNGAGRGPCSASNRFGEVSPNNPQRYE